MNRRSFCYSAALAALVPADPLAAAGPGDWIAYIGTYTRQKSKGIYAYRFDAKTGSLTEIGLVAETSNPSFLAVHPNQRFIYAVNENSTYQGQPAGSVSAFSIDAATGKLKLLNTVSSKGPGPCHLAVDRTGKWLMVANYGGGSVASYGVKADGSLSDAITFVQHTGSGPNKPRQAAPHAHATVMTPDNRMVLVADLGLDKVLEYKLDPATGTLTAADFGAAPPGSGPRHLAFSKDGHFVYGINEILCTVTVYRFDDKHGELSEVQTIPTLPSAPTPAQSTAEIVVHPNGRFLYGSNRGADTIALFQIDVKTGKLTAGDRTPTQGKTPRNFAIDPTGAYLFAANQDSDSIVLFKIDEKTGALKPAGKTVEVGAPVCVVFAAPK